MSSVEKYLQISAQTWPKEVYELVDYESNSLISSQINIQTAATIYREDNIIRGTDDHIEDEKEILFKIKSNILNKNTINFELYNNQAIINENNIISKK